MLDLAALTPIRVSRLQGPDVFTVAPVYGHISSKAGFVSAINVHLAISSFGQALCSRERLIVESWLFRTASEHVVLETKRLPLLEILLVNIGCWPVELVAAGGLLNPYVR
jgi:hypothetical protein